MKENKKPKRGEVQPRQEQPAGSFQPQPEGFPGFPFGQVPRLSLPYRHGLMPVSIAYCHAYNWKKTIATTQDIRLLPCTVYTI